MMKLFKYEGGVPMRIFALVALGVVLLASGPVMAKGNAEDGKKVYVERCVWCHGEEGDGKGAGGEIYKRINPPPRDFSSAMYKFKTSPYDDDFPNDADIFRMIRDGMPGSNMPSWSSVLKEEDMWNLVAYVKSFAELEEESGKKVEYGTQVATSPESIAKGSKLFHDGARCSECHGEEGKGSAIKRLKGDDGSRTWPRNFTKPWRFRVSNDAKEIFTRISTGIPGTQMPSFADPRSKKKLSIEERWHVANYVRSLAKTGNYVVRAANTVVKAEKLAGELPGDPNDGAWKGAGATTFAFLPQIVYKDRNFKMTNDTVTVKALFNDADIAFLLEWDDRTKSIPGDADAIKLAGTNFGPDQIAIQLPLIIPDSMRKPYFIKGDTAHPVNLLYWNSGTTDKPESVTLANGTGVDAVEKRDAAAVGLAASSFYKDGTWKVVIKRKLTTDNTESDIQFKEGRFIPIAFQNWDGSNDQVGSKHTMTTWYWLLLKPPASSKPLFTGLILAALVFGVLVLWARSVAKKEEDVA